MAQSSTSGTSSRRHAREHDTASLASSRFPDAEWEATETMRKRELEEARARAAQMEKTMRWWSDCTANWRDKWSKVRNERNKARDESKQLRTKLDMALKDSNIYKKEKQDVELQNDHLKKEIEKIHILLLKHAGQFDTQIFEALGEEFSSTIKVNGIDCDSTTEEQKNRSILAEEYVLHGAVPKQVDNDEKNSITSKSHSDEYDEEYLMQKMSMLQLRLDETNKTLQSERDDKAQMHHTLERLGSEVQELKEKLEECREARQEAVREMLTLQDTHQEEIRLLKCDLQDETNTRDGMDRRINDLRAELERLQAENAAEWGKRERLETEKLTLERENKKLRAELRDIQERIERKGRPITNSDAEFRHLQSELVDRNKEIVEYKHAQSKLKKLLQERITENAHAARRAEQYETDVKKLRARVEELKRDLALAEDEIDVTSNAMRKLQRTNDELQEQVDNCHVQLQHLNSRLRNSSSAGNLLNVSSTTMSDEEVSNF
ncbi:coiled-coil domain-containing protein 102A-like isoform X2 [Atheta coriaria]|uniref:coiled-coil domain-containing protein 102A-like isoform X2 n=1 Tax=Dalotia coriaria TaxID=877792 RepID=UPI0031F3CA1A